MSTVTVERTPSPGTAPAVVLIQSNKTSSSRSQPSEEDDRDATRSSRVEPSTSAEKDPKKKSAFNFKKTAKNVVNGITRKKKGLIEEKSKSSDDLRMETGDQEPKTKVTPFNKMLSTLHNPNNKLNRMWSSLNKTVSSSTSQAHFPEMLTETRSTMTLGRFFGKKRDHIQELPPMKEGRKAHTLGGMFTFAKIPARKSRDPEAAD